jgi:energy-coupling factor transport system ATP-binding protein
MVGIEAFSYQYRDSARHALRDFSLEVEPGELVVVTGPSGCGKSTLALAIGGYLFRQFDGVNSGSVTVAGSDARTSPIYDLAEVVGLVQQNPEAQFCTLTVEDEVAFGLENRRLPPAEIRRRLTWALDVAGAEHLAGRELATLSGGEKQKVAIAAVMAARPQVLIFDEPTSNLDPPATAEIFQVIDRIRAEAGITVIVIEHKVGYLARHKPRLIEMPHADVPCGACQAPDTAHAPAPRGAGSRHSRHSDGPIVRVENLCAAYNGQAVLHDLSLELHAGEFVSLMGDNGSGKTTLLNCLVGLQRPSQGRVETVGRDTQRTPVSELARDVGLVFQNPDHQLFADTVWEEAVFAARNFGLLDGVVEARVAELLERCGLGDRLDEHPYRLSYGQKRRLNLVSVLSYQPRLILLDEPLIGQDPANAEFLLGLLRRYVDRGGAVVLVNHAPQITRRYADRMLFLEEGRPVIDAPVDRAFGELRALEKEGYVA